MSDTETTDNFANNEQPSQSGDFQPPPSASNEFNSANNKEITDLKDTINKLQQENEQLKDSFLRSKAEAANIQTRSQQEILKAKQFGTQNLIKELLPVLDSLEKAIEACTEDKEGLELIHNLITEVLNKEGVTIINPIGENFDPKYHEAIAIENDKDKKKDIVLKVMQTGYKIKDRSIRAALVVVNK